MVEVMNPDVSFVSLHHLVNPPEHLGIPAINHPIGSIRYRLLSVILSFEDRDSSNKCTVHFNTNLPGTPSVSCELTTQIPLSAPGGPKLCSSLLISNITSSCIIE